MVQKLCTADIGSCGFRVQFLESKLRIKSLDGKRGAPHKVGSEGFADRRRKSC